MNLIIFGGFLGSGKTSVILSFARYLVELEKPTQESRLVIIENEIGETGIDNKVLQSGGFSVRELFAGCICCTLSSDLTVTLNELAETLNPKWVILESTGLAYPGKIMDTVKQYGKGIDSIRIITLVDAERWNEILEILPILAEKQVGEADIVLINKIDLVSEEELAQITQSVIALNPRAEIKRISANKGIAESIWKEAAGIKG